MAEQHSSKSIMWATIIIAIVLIAIVFPLTVKKSTSAADAAKGNDEADVRIQPVAKFELAKAAAPAAGGAPKDGATVFNTVCGACHNTGAAGAPKGWRQGRLGTASRPGQGCTLQERDCWQGRHAAEGWRRRSCPMAKSRLPLIT